LIDLKAPIKSQRRRGLDNEVRLQTLSKCALA